MIFQIDPSQVQRLDGKQLVELLRRLLYAEAQLSGLSLRSVSAPLQITTADGGEDARVHWTDGEPKTDFFPCRFNVFQSKATDLPPAGWRREVWSKPSQKDGAPKELNDAMKEVISARGAYIGFTSAAIVGNKMSSRIKAIKEGICDAGEDPEKLAAIQIYDANQITAWVGRHPGVAVWLNEEQKRASFGGFQTIRAWGRRPDFSAIKTVDDLATRYGVGVVNSEDRATSDSLTSKQAKQRILDHIQTPKTSVRIVGPSGVGKSRFVFDFIDQNATLEGLVVECAAVYCDFRSVGQVRLHQALEEMAHESVPALMIVDECPRESAIALAHITSYASSRLRLITIDTDDRPLKVDNTLDLSVSKSDDALVEAIIRQRDPRAETATISYLKNLCDGFPRIAVLATDNHLGGMPALNSIEDVVDRVLAGCGLNHRDQLRAIECLSLFERIGYEGSVASHLDLVAQGLARLSGDEMYEYLATASKHELVDRRGVYFRPQPRPIAAFLGARRIDLLRAETILSFIDSAPNELVLSFLQQWRFFDKTRTAVSVAEGLLKPDGRFGTKEALSSTFGAECLEALTHVAPDSAAAAIRRAFDDASLEELETVTEGRRSLVRVLERLAFRRQFFLWAARLLLRLASVETESFGNNATSQFKQLFQVALSGTETEPAERFIVIDDAIKTGDVRTLRVCVEALDASLQHSYLSRTAGAEELGSGPPLQDWEAKTWDQLFDFHRQSLARLEQIAQTHTSLEERCDNVVASNLRALISEPFLDDVERSVKAIVQRRGVWLGGVQALGEWLYFDRKGSPQPLQQRVRSLYDSLIPTDLADLVLLYTAFWKGEIHDPDADYGPDDTFEYSTDKAVSLARQIAKDEELTSRTVRTLAARKLNNIFPFAAELARHVADPRSTFQLALGIVTESKQLDGIAFLRGLLSGIDDRDVPLASECMKIALSQKDLQGNAIDFHTAVAVSSERLAEIVASVKAGTLQPSHCVLLSYGKGLDALSAEQILPLIDELTTNHGSIGAWCAVEIVSMYQLGRRVFDPVLLARMVGILGSPVLVGAVHQRNLDGHLFESMILAIDKHGGLTPDFAATLAEQFARLCHSDNGDAFHALDDYAKKVMKLLVSKQPDALWSVISRFVQRATPSERRRLSRLVEASSRNALGSEEPQLGSGALYGAPDQLYFDWADADPASRAVFLCEFFPVFHKDQSGEIKWHSAMEALASRYGSESTFRGALGSRLVSSFWSGSFSSFVEPYLSALERWFGHKMPELAVWAKDTHFYLENRIEAARRMDDGVV
ncbi:hypothetical protein [Caballeronia sp. GACF5]|uniref:hypothetical protein n=1 Tax=Caballeronia sp. GACF5 TaxID=2921746 RepID=UPI002027BDFC|nr:hypothetical protein [Caballeronia sp. GACF5]